jgi:hypothetical protein
LPNIIASASAAIYALLLKFGLPAETGGFYFAIFVIIPFLLFK